jgi:hypothetical protein
MAYGHGGDDEQMRMLDLASLTLDERPALPGLMVVRILPATERITIVTTPKTRAGTCPGCGTTPTRIHSRYRRTLDDLPWQGRALRIHVRARRLRCTRANCPRRIAEGCRNATQLWRERRARGFPGPVILVRAWVRRLEGEAPSPPPRVAIPVWRQPIPGTAVRMLLSGAKLADTDTTFLATLCAEPAIGSSRGWRARAAGRWTASPRVSGATMRRWKPRCGCRGARARSRGGSASSSC